MGLLVFRKFPAAGVVALFEEPNTSGAIDDINAGRNAPALHPEDHLDLVHFHSGLDYLEVAASATVPFAHASVGSTGGSTGQNIVYGWAGTVADNVLLDITALGLSREPFCIVAAGGNILWPGIPVQTDTGGRNRYCTAYSTTTAVRLWESATKTSSSLAGVTIDYDVLVFRDPPAALNSLLEAFDPDTGAYALGFDRFRSDRRYLQLANSSPLNLATDRNIDLKNGAQRAIRADGTAFDLVPEGARAIVSPGTGSYGGLITYDGSFTGSPSVQVEAP
jgi:hypothetical protein